MSNGQQGPPPDYVEVSERIDAFRSQYPEGVLSSEVLPSPIEGFVCVKAYAFRDREDTRPGTGLAWEPVPGKTNFTRDSELMNAETSAWGRALVAVGAADAKRGVASANEVRARQQTSSPPQQSTENRGAPPQGQGQQGQTNEASKKQVGLILHSLSELGLEDRHITNLLATQYGQDKTRVSSLTRKQASGLIDWINQYPDKVKEWAGLNDSGNGQYAQDVEDVPLPEEPPQDAPL